MTDAVVSVIIPVRNVERTLALQLEALLAQDAPMPFEVVVADNGSTDGTREVVERFAARSEKVRYVRAGEKRGVSFARNAGVRAATGNILLFCDGDDEAEPSWLREMAAGAGHFDLWSGTLDMKALNSHGYVLEGKTGLMPQLPSVSTVPFVGGASFGIRRDVLDSVGGWDETYEFGGSDDVELSWRCLLAGYRIGTCRDAVMRYRLRTGYRAHFVQTFFYGVGNVKLASDFERHGLIRRSGAHELFEAIGFLARLAPRIFKGVPQRVRLVRRLGFFFGMLYGSVVFRIFYMKVPL
jgi:glycosyltransferase involved in cell wall biosynthesis